MQVGWTSLIAIFVVAVGMRAWGGSVEMGDGQNYVGEVTLEEGGKVRVVSDRGEVKVLELGEVRKAVMGGKVGRAATTGPATVATTAPATNRVAEAGWVGVDVGEVEPAGKSTIIQQRVVIVENGAGLGLRKRSEDSLHFVYQRLKGEGAVVARVRAFQDWRLVRVGVMIRKSLEARSAYAALARGQLQVSGLLVRAEGDDGPELMGESEKRILGAIWLKLERKGYTMTASESLDGKGWTKVGEANLAIGPDEEMFAGVFAASARTRNEVDGRTVFDHVEVMRAESDEPKGEAGKWPRGVVLRDGTVLAGEILSATEKEVTISRDGKGVTVGIGDVARLAFLPLAGAVAQKAQHGARGGGDAEQGFSGGGV